MARPLRIERAGCWYHITARGNERRETFRDTRDRAHFLELLAEMVDLFAVRLHAYVLMANHYHLLLEITEPNLSRAIHWLNVSYTVWFNRRHGRSGHLFQGRFKSIVVEPEPWGLEVSRYIHLNPVRVTALGLGKKQLQSSRAVGRTEVNRRQVKDRIARLRKYRWSSYRAYIGLDSKPGWLTVDKVLELAGKAAEPKERYRRYCEEEVREGLVESPWEHVIGQAVLGTKRFAQKLTTGAAADDRERRKVGKRPTLDEIIRAVEKVRGERWEQFRDRHGDYGRDLVMHLGRRKGGLGIRTLADVAGIEYMSAATAIRRFSERAEDDPTIRKLIEQTERQMKNE
jgi:REP element-mobilizing transposase RayT